MNARNLVSRRTALKAALMSVGYAVTAPAPSATPTVSVPSSTPTRSPTATPSPYPSASSAPVAQMLSSESVEQLIYSTDWLQARTFQFPRVTTWGSSLDAFECRVHWDARMFSVSDSVFALADEIVEVDVQRIDAETIVLKVPATAQSLFFDVSAVSLYPSENLSEPIATTFRLIEEGDPTERELLTFDTVDEAVTPWGVELSAQWTTVEGAMVPSMVQISSIGPNPTPPGLTLNAIWPATSDNSEPSALDGVSFSATQDGVTSTLTAVMSASIAAGEAVSIFFDRPRADTTPAKNQIVVSSAAVQGFGKKRDMRNTGRLSVLPITDSGLPVSTFKEASSTA